VTYGQFVSARVIYTCPSQQLNPAATRPMRMLEDARCIVSVAYKQTHTWPTHVWLVTFRAGPKCVGAPRRLIWRPLKPILFKLFRYGAGPTNLSRASAEIAHNFRRNVFACGNATSLLLYLRLFQWHLNSCYCIRLFQWLLNSCYRISDCSSGTLTPVTVSPIIPAAP
jgi:hypothetical protein